jgi:hypothetical protein
MDVSVSYIFIVIIVINAECMFQNFTNERKLDEEIGQNNKCMIMNI